MLQRLDPQRHTAEPSFEWTPRTFPTPVSSYRRAPRARRHVWLFTSLRAWPSAIVLVQARHSPVRLGDGFSMVCNLLSVMYAC